jgi:hypothetical protein
VPTADPAASSSRDEGLLMQLGEGQQAASAHSDSSSSSSGLVQELQELVAVRRRRSSRAPSSGKGVLASL